MKDFKVISAKAVLPVFAVAPVRGFDPPSLAVRGQGLNLASEVYLNDSRVDEFVITGPDRLLIKVPKDQYSQPLRNLRVLADSLLTRSDAVIELALPRPVTLVEGLGRLVQMFVITLLTTPGSDIFEPDSGGGANTLVGRNTDKRGRGVEADLVLAIEKTKNEILRLQSKQSNLPMSEKLLSADIQSMHFDAAASALNARVSLTNMLSEQAEVSLG
jgi:hypothetical protein